MAQTKKDTSGPSSQKDSKTEPSPGLLSIATDKNTHRALQLILIAAIYSQISWLSLTPVYGSVPAALYRGPSTMLALTTGFLSRHQLRKILPANFLKWLPSFAFWIPTIQFILFKYSAFIGATLGPVITEWVTCYPLLFFSLYAVGLHWDEVDFSGFGDSIAPFAPVLATFVAFSVVGGAGGRFLVRNIGANFIFSRIGLQIFAAGVYVLAIPGAVVWPAIPSVAFNVIHNVHNPLQRTTNLLNSTLQSHNFSLIARQESITGYISVLENHAAGYRVMRCDHSLLGGEWIVPSHKDRRTAEVHEPIFGIFAMLEAVRLVETNDGLPRRSDSESSALNIGLGIGTAPGALIAHGINTSIVELDPVVYKFALEHFNLPKRHMPLIGDAISLIEDAKERNISLRYDYIIHDVFTGGAEPVELFTHEFLSGLRFLLKEDGVIAINYAGDLSLPAPTYVLQTIFSVFGTCRIFREVLPDNSLDGGQTDFTNMAVFCKHPASRSPLKFRLPSESDLLGSQVRKQFLYPRPELEINPAVFNVDTSGQILRRGQTAQLERWHQRGAVGHWGIMRTVLPAAVWENW